MQLISIQQWADKNGITARVAYRWAKTGKLPTRTRKVTVRGVPANVTIRDIVKGKGI